MKKTKAFLAMLSIALFFVAFQTMFAHASPKNEDLILHSMQEKLQFNGLSPRTASKLAKENVFIGMVMLRATDKSAHSHDAQKVGASLGQVIASTYLSYGEKAIPRAVSAMMNATRSGVAPDMLAKTYRAMAKRDYPLDKAVALIHGISEVATSVSFKDGGVALGNVLAVSIEKNKPYVELQKQVLYASKLQDTLNKRTQLAKAQQEKKKAEYARKRSQGGGAGGGYSSSPAGGSLSSGGVSSASASSGGGSKSGGTSAGGASGGDQSGGSSGGNSSSGGSGSASGGSDSGGSSGGNSSSGGSGSSSGGSDSGGSSGGNSSSGGSDSSSGGSDSGGSSGGDASGNDAGAQ